MTPVPSEGAQRSQLTAQLGRAPRSPWRVAVSCSFDYPVVVTSPSMLDDGTRFPTWAWLSCPHLVASVGALESSGGAAMWARRAESDPDLAAALHRLDQEVREARRCESGGEDACAGVGAVGQRDPLGIKCLHAHVAYELVGLDDPIGAVVLGEVDRECADGRCAALHPLRET